MWVNPEDDDSGLFGGASRSGSPYSVKISSGQLYAQFLVNSVWEYGPSSPINSGQWQHIAVTYDGDVIKNYLNGNLESEPANTSEDGSIDKAGNGFRIGRVGNIYYHTGKIDDVMIFDKALSDTEIESLVRIGTSWKYPFEELTQALEQAENGDQIWVAEGTYLPGDEPNDTFLLKNGVELYGGYPNNPPLLFSDDFNDANYAGWNIVDEGTPASNWSASSGEMVQSSNTTDGQGESLPARGTYAWCSEGTDWYDYDVTLSMKSDNGGSIGVMFRYQDPNNYYRFSWNKQYSYRRLIKRVDGNVTLLAVDSVPYVEDTVVYDVEIAAYGDILQVFIDDELVFSVEDDSISLGSIALYSCGNIGSHFDDVEVKTYKRDRKNNKTYLSGDIGENGNDADNTYHVVTGNGTDRTAVLDGFIIKDGHANGTGIHGDGAGVYNNGGSPIINNCEFTENIAEVHGGAICNTNASAPLLANCIFVRNPATL
jgi:hypothetical protein